jgi:hypothetical protein
MLRRLALVRTDVSEELSASIIRVTRIGELGTRKAGEDPAEWEYIWARGSVVDWSIMLQAWKSRLQFLTALEAIQTLAEMSTRNLPESKGRPERKRDNFTAISEPIV